MSPRRPSRPVDFVQARRGRRRSRPGHPGAGCPADPVPSSPTLFSAAVWSWRLIGVGIVLLAVGFTVSRLTVVLIPVLAAFFFTALLRAPVAQLRVRHLRRGAAAGLVLLLAVAFLAGIGYLTSARVSSQAGDVSNQIADVLSRLQPRIDKLFGGSRIQASDLLENVVHWLQSNRLTVAQDVVMVGSVAAKTVTIALLTLFLTYFFLADGDRIWSWLVRLAPGRLQSSVNGAGYAGWRALTGWIRGTTVIATFHACVIGATLWLLGAPLVLPLALLVFLGSFFPIVGALVFGGLAVLVVLLTGGVVHAAVLLAVLIVEDQIEAHLLQPFVVGRAVHLHPVTIVLGLTAGGEVGGLLGAIIVVPVLAAGHAAVKYLTGVEDLHGLALGGDRMEPIPPEESAPLPGFDVRSAKSAGVATGRDKPDRRERPRD